MGKAIKTHYKLMYGGNASITEHSDGTATLVVAWAGGRRRTECNSKASAKRTLSRYCDGFYSEIG